VPPPDAHPQANQTLALDPGARPRVLIIKPSSLGDIVHALPLLAGLRAKYPHAEIHWLVASAFAPFLEGRSDLTGVIRFDRRLHGRAWRSPAAAAALARFLLDLRARRFDLVVDAQGLLRSALFARFSGARVRVGFAHAREGAALLYTHRVKLAAEDRHAVQQVQRLVEFLRLPAAEYDAALLQISPEERAAAEALLPAGPRIAVLPGARWASKRWPAASFAALIDRIGAAQLGTCVLLGAPDEAALAAEIAGATRGPCANLAGRTTLRQLTAILDACAAVVCNDSGPMHIAAALGRPTVALFGPTDATRTGPYSPAARVLTRSLECAPCRRRVCPLGHHACLRELPAEQVFQALRTMLSAPDPATAATR